MAAHTPSGELNSNLDGTTHTQTPPTYFNAPEFRTKIVQILTQTANGCLQELNFHPRMVQEITELKSRIDHYHETNKNLYDDNKSLLSMVMEARNKLGAYSGTIHQLEQQVAALHKANQNILMRERSLASGNPAYQHLQSEYWHLSTYCTQLKQQIWALQRMVFEKPTLQHVPGPSQQPSVITEGGQTLPIKQSAAHSAHEAVREPQEHLNHIRSLPSHTGALGQGRPSQAVESRPSVSRPSVVIRPGPLNLPTQGNNSISAPSVCPWVQSNQPMINNASQIWESPSSQPATRTSDVMRNRASEAVGPVPKITGWMDNPSSHAVGTHPRMQNLSAHAASLQHERSASAQLRSSGSPSTPGSTMDQNNRNTKPRSVIMRPPDVNVPPEMNFVPIGPPGKLLPPLVASVMKHSSPPSRPPSTRASTPSGTMYTPEPAHAIGVINPPPLDTSMDGTERSRTPNLTPTSSRNSVAPSEGELEATTPLDDHVNYTVKVVKSPVSGVEVESDVVVLEAATSASSLKRSNSDVQGDEDGKPSDVGESVRKRLRMSENVASERNEDGKTISTNSSLQFMDEGTGDHKEEDEFGPDGKPSVEYCLDVFTEEDGDVDICALCRLRQESGLIPAPTIFSPNVTQEAKVQHFLDEHPTAWENMKNGRGCS